MDRDSEGNCEKKVREVKKAVRWKLDLLGEAQKAERVKQRQRM